MANQTPRRYSDVAPPQAPSLRDVQGKELTVSGATIEMRRYNGADRNSVTIHTDKGDYHVWSDTLARALQRLIDDEAFSEGPIVCIFDKEQTRSGQTTWVIK